MTGKTKYTTAQRAEIWGGRALSFLGGLAGGTGILGVLGATALDAAGTELTDKGKGVKMTSKAFWSIAAKNAGYALGGAALGVFGKYGSDFLKSRKLGVAARDSESIFRDSLRKPMLGVEDARADDFDFRDSARNTMLGAKGDPMQGVEGIPSSDFSRVKSQQENMSKLHQMGVNIHPGLKDVEVQAFDAHLEEDNSFILGFFKPKERFHQQSGRDRILIYSKFKDTEIDYTMQEKTFLHEISHFLQKIEAKSTRISCCCEYGHAEDFQRLHNIAVIRAFGTGGLSEERFFNYYMKSYIASSPSDDLEIERYYGSLMKDFREKLGRDLEHSDELAFKRFLAETPLSYNPREDIAGWRDSIESM